MRFTKSQTGTDPGACLVRRQIDIELVRIDVLTQNQYVFSFQNQLKDKKFTMNEK